jgi:hypothetical protein
MSFAVYPDAETSVLLGTPEAEPVRLEDGAAMAEFVLLKELVSPPGPLTRSMTFVRIAFSGAAIPQDVAQAQPTVELRAHRPDGTVTPAKRVHPSQATSLPQAVPLQLGSTTLAQAFFTPPYDDNVYLLTVRIIVAGTRFSLKITNTTGARRDIVWVVADKEADTRQPWIRASLPGGSRPNRLAFLATVGDARKESSIEVTNRGTGPVTISVDPPVAAPYTISQLPVTLGPNPAAPARLTIGFQVPNVAGKTPASQHRLATPDGGAPGPFAVNHTFTLSAETKERAVSPPPKDEDVLGPCLALNGTQPCSCREFLPGSSQGSGVLRRCARPGCRHTLLKHLPREDQPSP